jgi:hypothetical protein
VAGVSTSHLAVHAGTTTLFAWGCIVLAARTNGATNSDANSKLLKFECLAVQYVGALALSAFESSDMRP